MSETRKHRILEFLRQINQRRLILGLSLVIGALAGLAAVLLKSLTHLVDTMPKLGSWESMRVRTG